jgi:hypothetical protein
MVERRAGQHVRQWTRTTARRGLAAMGGVLLIGALVGVAAGFTSWTFIAAELAVLLALVAIDRFVVPLVERRDSGATGEEHVGAILDALAPRGWRVVHDIDTGRIDVDRIDPSMCRQAYAQAKWVEEATGAQATPLLVFSRAYLSRPVARRRGVTVLPARMLSGHLLRRRHALSTAEIERLAGVLLSPTRPRSLSGSRPSRPHRS